MVRAKQDKGEGEGFRRSEGAPNIATAFIASPQSQLDIRVAMPRKEKKPATSVTVVRMIDED